MATFAEIKTRVGQIVIDLPTTVTAQLSTLVNEAIRTLQRTHDFRVMQATTSVFTTTNEDDALGAVPSDFKGFRGRPMMINQDGSVTRLEVLASKEEAWATFGTDAGGEADVDTLVGSPKGIYIGEPSDTAGTSAFVVAPFADDLSLYTNGNYRIVIPYWKFLPALSADADTNWFTVNCDDFITYQAAAEAFFDDHDTENGTYWQQKAAGRYQEIIASDKQARIQQRDTLIPQPDALRTPLSRATRFGQRWTRGGL